MVVFPNQIAHFDLSSRSLNFTPMEENDLIKLLTTEMPFGKYKGTKIADLPEFYLVWFHSKGFPKGKVGQLMGLMYEIRLNGLTYLLEPLRKR